MRDCIEGVAFDLDGTLYPNRRLNIKLVPFLFKETRLLTAFGRARNIIRAQQKDAPERLIPDFYRKQAEITAKIMKKPPELVKERIENFIYRGWEPLFKEIKLFTGAVETISSLRAAGLKLGLMSDFPTETKLQYLGLDGLWDAVLCSEKCGALKPHPLPFTELACAMGVPPEKILYVGNSRPYDVKGAYLAGMKTAWIKSPLFPGSGIKKPKPDFSFSNYRQLSDYMLK